jgi:hypothetical protein
MPVVLPVSTRQQSDDPRPPHAVVWLVLFVVIMLAGVVGTLLTWPKSEPTNTPWFWVQLLVLPALAWTVAFGLRLHYYDDEVARLKADDDVLEEDRAKAIRFASEPLAVVGLSYLCSSGAAGVAKKVVQGESALAAQTSKDGKDGKRHTSLPYIDNEDGMGRFGPCFESLLKRIHPAIQALPQDVALDVRLHLPEQNRGAGILAWRQCWSQSGLRRAPATLLPTGQGLMALDEWLDIKGGPQLERFVLFVSVQLHDAPPENSAEAAVALLLGWAPLAVRRGLHPLAMLHRPIVADGTTPLEDSVRLVLQWGRTTPDQVNDLWQAALPGDDKGALLQTAVDTTLAMSQTAELAGVHDIDTALGDPGVCARWLTAALAAEYAGQTGAPQLMVWREGALHLAIAQPAAPSKEQMELKA